MTLISNTCAISENENKNLSPNNQASNASPRILSSIRGGKLAWIIIASVGASVMIIVFLYFACKLRYTYIPGSFTPGYVAQK